MRLRHALLLLPLAVAPLLVTSPTACGCEPDPTSMAGQMGIYVADRGTPASAQSNQALGERAFIGKDIHRLAKSPSPDAECVWLGSTRLECTYWNEVGVLHSRGRVVHVEANATGEVTAVSVSNIRKIMGVSTGAGA